MTQRGLAVAWHVALGRDDELFTAPHSAILGGLVLASARVSAHVLAAARIRSARRS